MHEGLSHKNTIMKYHIHCNFLLLVSTVVVLFSCKKKSDDTNGSGGNGGGNGSGGGGSAFNITGSSPEYLYWGDVLTISGTGFSTNKADYNIKFIGDLPGCDLSPFEMISATNDQLKIKMPIGLLSGTTKKCGPASAPLIITANGKSDTSDVIKFLGYPRIQSVCTHFGGSAGNYLIPGDSTSMNMAGATGIWAAVNNSNTNAVLTVDNINVPITWRNYSACTNSLGGVITLDKEIFSKLKCSTDPDWGGGGRMLKFKLSNPGTDRFDTASFFVNWMPIQSFEQHIGAPQVSMSAGGFPTWTIKGKDMTYHTAKFTSTNCNLTPQTVAINHNGTFYNEGTFPIPLSVLTVGCNYSVSIISHCGTIKVLGALQINP